MTRYEECEGELESEDEESDEGDKKETKEMKEWNGKNLSRTECWLAGVRTSNYELEYSGIGLEVITSASNGTD
jgi:hypothetical protein